MGAGRALLILRAAGNHLGWGFQMQSPGFVLALIFLFFLLGLNLFGVFELGTSLVGLDAKATGHVGTGLASSFLNGALATLAATPCTAPFMGSALGFAAQQPPFISLLIFTFLALGMAAPYLLLTIFPGALRFRAEAGRVDGGVQAIHGFSAHGHGDFSHLRFRRVGGRGAGSVACLSCCSSRAVAAWIYGRWVATRIGRRSAFRGFVLALGCSGYRDLIRVDAGTLKPCRASARANAGRLSDGWQPWTPAAVDQALAQGQPVFVDFTAAWCLSCKVNEQIALETDAVQQAFAQKNVALFRADWTHSDPAISAALRKISSRRRAALFALFARGQGFAANFAGGFDAGDGARGVAETA